MFYKIYFVIFILTEIVNAQSNCGVSGNPSGLIVNGWQSKRGQWPWLVAIYEIDENKFICGGSLVSSSYVITASHCIQNKNQNTERKPQDLVIKLGRYDLSQQYERGAFDAYPSKIIKHPDWNTLSVKFDADIAIIELTNTVFFTDLIFPICLPLASFDVGGGKGFIAGWGKSESIAMHENITKEIEVTISKSNEDCFFKNSRFAEISSPNTFCAGKEGESGPCSGDSGGGLFLLHQNRWYLKGIVSSSFISNGRCDVSQDAVFTNVPKYLTWINQIMTGNSVIGQQNPQILSTPTSVNQKEIVCYVANWAMYRPDDGAFSIENLKADLCTTAIYHFAGLDERGALKSLDPWADLEDNGGKNGFKRFTGLKKLYPNLHRTLLSVGGWNERSEKFSKLSAISSKRKNFARQSADFLKRYGFDGLNVFWEWPGSSEQGGTPEDKENYVLLLQDIAEVYRTENLYLSATLRTEKWMTDIAYDIPNIAKSVDAINLMTFDYAGVWLRKIGFGAPLYSDRQVDVKTAIDLFIDSGAPIEKLILGIPFYGRTFIAKNEYHSDIGDESEKTGFGGPFIEAASLLGYNEFCKMKNDKHWRFQFNAGASQMVGEFSENGKVNVVTFETPRSVANKVKFAMENGLLGVWAWSTDTDDFNGLCPIDINAYNDFGYKKPPMVRERDFPLLRTINNVMRFMGAKK